MSKQKTVNNICLTTRSAYITDNSYFYTTSLPGLLAVFIPPARCEGIEKKLFLQTIKLQNKY